MKILKKIYVILFILALIGPGITFSIVRDHIDTDNYQNRELHEFPNMSSTAFAQFPLELEAYYNDHLPFKNQLTQLNTYIDIKLFHNADSDSVVLGKEGWLFYKTGGNISDYRGVISISAEELEYIKTELTRAKEFFSSRGIKFIVLLAPNKEEIYSQYLPSYIDVINSESRLDKIAKSLEEANINVVYPKEELIKRSEEYQVYRKYDTHWNRVGAFIAAQELLEELGKEAKKIDEITVVPAEKISGDLANMLGVAKLYNDDEEFNMLGEGNNIELIVDVPQQNLAYREYKSSVGEDRILILGDSFTNDMTPYVAEKFSFSAQVHVNNYEKGMIEKIKPSVVVCELVERSAPGIGDFIKNIIDIEQE